MGKHQSLKLRRQKVSDPQFKFTKDMVNERFIRMLQGGVEQPNNQPTKPNILQLLRAKKEQGKGKWPLT